MHDFASTQNFKLFVLYSSVFFACCFLIVGYTCIH